jgi:hypothetical protein
LQIAVKIGVVFLIAATDDSASSLDNLMILKKTILYLNFTLCVSRAVKKRKKINENTVCTKIFSAFIFLNANPSSLLLIYKSMLRQLLDYCYTFFLICPII